jgi:hypothetical protein
MWPWLLCRVSPLPRTLTFVNVPVKGLCGGWWVGSDGDAVENLRNTTTALWRSFVGEPLRQTLCVRVGTVHTLISFSFTTTTHR